jgi:fructokinase
LYLTVGTGIGGGAVVAGEPLHGLLHPEMGHVMLPRERWPDGAPDGHRGSCPFHGDCFEGMASGPALEARLGAPGQAIAGEHPIWDLEAAYIASALATYAVVLSPQRIVIGGGVMQQPGLLPRIRRRLVERLNGYIARPQLRPAGVDEYVVAPRFGQDAGLIGAFALAQRAAR